MFLLVAMGCATAPPSPTTAPADPTWSDAERACAHAWYGTTTSLTELHRAAGRDVPDWPTLDAALAVCRGLGVDADLAACLDGAWYAAHPEACAARMAERPRVRSRWNALFEEVL